MYRKETFNTIYKKIFQSHNFSFFYIYNKIMFAKKRIDYMAVYIYEITVKLKWIS